MSTEKNYWELVDGDLDGWARLIFRNPPANTLSFDAQAKLLAVLEELESRTDVRVVTVESAVEGFYCSGAEITELDSLADPAQSRQIVARLHMMFSKLENLPQITVSVIDGVAAGGGAELALACDFRVARAGVKIGLPEVKLGLIPGGGGTQRLAHLLGARRALQLIISGKLLDADTAARMGLVDRVATEGTALEGARAWIAEFASFSGVALRAAKRAVYASAGSDGYGAEIEAFATCAASEDMAEGVAAFLERRPATFRHR